MPVDRLGYLPIPCRFPHGGSGLFVLSQIRLEAKRF